jgi:dTDP-glucose 4,6-dehydratase
MKTILITGGAGFQGVNLARSLKMAGGYRVSILNTWSDRAQQSLTKFGLADLPVIWGSITDKNLLDKTIRDVDMVVHAAANIHVDESIAEPGKYYEVNVLGTNNVLNLCTQRKIPLLHISSCEVYGDHGSQTKLKECSGLLPNSPYASSKAGADVMCYSYFKTFGTSVVVVRPSNVYGPGQKSGQRGAVIPIFVGRALRGETLQIFGSGKQRREFVYIDDLVNAYRILIDRMLDANSRKLLSGRCFNLGSGNTSSVSELAELILKHIKTTKIVNVPARPGEVGSFVLDSDTAYQMLSWRARTMFQDGLTSYIKWVQENEA